MVAFADVNREEKFLFKRFLIISIICLPITTSTHIEIDKNGGYKKIVIAVSKRTLETISDLSELESNLKNFFSSVSEKLYQATRNQSFFKEIQVLLPYSIDPKIDISKVKIGDSEFESYQESDIRFDTFNPVPSRGDLYTNQPRGCGKRGDFIYLNPDYIKDWSGAPNDVKVDKFVQEWSKFRYGVFEENGDDNGIFPSNYATKNGNTERTGCAAPDNSSISIMDDVNLRGRIFCDETVHTHNKIAPNRHNALCKNKGTWNIISRNDDFTNISLNMRPIPELKINFVKLLANVIIVIDPSLSVDGNGLNVQEKESHLLNLALRKFIQDSPDYVQIGIIVAYTYPERTNMANESSMSLVDEFHYIITRKVNITAKNLTAGINAGYESLKNLPGNGYLIVTTSEKGLDELLNSSNLTLQLENDNLFLLTWTEKTTTIQWSNDNLEKMKNFVNYPSRNLWMNIKTETNIGDCDVNSRLQIEDASHQFYTRFLLDDFYSAKTKIGNYEMKPNEEHSFTLPLPSATVVFNIYGCTYGNEDTSASLKVNGNRETIKPEILDKYIAFSHDWVNPTPTKSDMSFEAQVSVSKSLGSSVWIVIPIGTTNFTAIDTKFEKKDVDNDSILIIHAFNPSDFNLEAQITLQNGNNITLKFSDYGNGDPDVIAGDKIYSRYFISPKITDGEYSSIKTIAKDVNGNIIDQRTVGTVPLKYQNTDRFPPSRIGDLHLKSVDVTSASAKLSWTSPGKHYDTGSASAYYIRCKPTLEKLNLEIPPTSFERINTIQLQPNVSGNIENYNWPVPSRETVFLCTLASDNQYSRTSEWSNIVSIYVDKLPTTPKTSTSTEVWTTPNSAQSGYPTTIIPSQTTFYNKLPDTLILTESTNSLDDNLIITSTFPTTTNSNQTSHEEIIPGTNETSNDHSTFQIICFAVCIINIVLFSSVITFLIYQLRKKITANQHPVKPNPSPSSPPKFIRNCRQSSQNSAKEKIEQKQTDSEIYSNDAIVDDEDIYDDVGVRASGTSIKFQTNVTISKGANTMHPYIGRLVKSQFQMEDYSQDEGVICPYATSPTRNDNKARAKCSIQ